MYGKNERRSIEDVSEFVARNSDKLEKLQSTEEGARVIRMLSGNSDELKRAIDSGDTKTLSGTFKQILSTDEGARLIEALQAMMGK